MKPAILGVVSFAAGAAISAAVFASGTTTATDKQAIETIIRDYIQEHPQEIVDSVKKWQMGESDRQMEAAKGKVQEKHAQLYEDKSDAYGGNPDADLVIVEFFDYNCPACKMMFQGLDKLVKTDKNVKVIFKEMPIFGDQSNQNSGIGLAVAKLAPEKYFAFHEGMMSHEGRIAPADAIKIAVGLGLKEEDIRKEAESEAVKDKINANHDLANELNIRGTPAIVIKDVLIPSAMGFNELKAKVDEARKQ